MTFCAVLILVLPVQVLTPGDTVMLEFPVLLRAETSTTCHVDNGQQPHVAESGVVPCIAVYRGEKRSDSVPFFLFLRKIVSVQLQTKFWPKKRTPTVASLSPRTRR